MKNAMKSAAASSRHNIQEVKSTLNKNLAQASSLKRKLEEKENVIRDLSTTHNMCRGIVGEFHQLKRRCVCDRL